MDPACPPALAVLQVTTAVMLLNMRVWAGDDKAAEDAAALAALLERERG